MKKPVTPPDWKKLLEHSIRDKDAIGKILTAQRSPTHNGRYIHWHKLRYLEPPLKLNHNEWWVSLKVARESQLRELPFVDTSGKPFRFTR